MKCGSGSATTSISADDNVNVNAPHQIWRLDKRVHNLGCFILYGLAGKANYFFSFFFFFFVGIFIYMTSCTKCLCSKKEEFELKD